MEFSKPRLTVQRANLITEILDANTKLDLNDKKNILDLLGSKNKLNEDKSYLNKQE